MLRGRIDGPGHGLARAGPVAFSGRAPGTCLTPLLTPDGRYLVVRGRLWRATNPNLDAESRTTWVQSLMDARRAVKAALRAADPERLAEARNAVNAAKIALGERGPVWWSDGAKDFNRCMVANSPYAGWHQAAMATAPG